ncbi:MAG: hypothetical protein HRU24_13345 [Gammaproteobacteria bacterium]|nr:hypothetical protein [Gammaproteobacteria bacterium]
MKIINSVIYLLVGAILGTFVMSYLGEYQLTIYHFATTVIAGTTIGYLLLFLHRKYLVESESD